MPLTSIRLSAWRNLADGQIDLSASRIFLIGENGQGKTNLLEAIYYLSYGTSFRGQVDGDIARRGEGAFAAEGTILRDLKDKVLPERISVVWKNRAKEIRREGKPVRDRKELVDLNPAVVYCHDDFSFAAGEPERRRFFFDQTAGLVSLGYIDLLRDYRKILLQRNAALKEAREGLLDVLDQQLAAKGLDLVAERRALASAFSEPFSKVFEEVARLGLEVQLRYLPNWKEGEAGSIDAVVQRLASRRREELIMKTSLSGPHRDRWGFVAEGRDFSATASTGQLRLLSLVLRSSQARHFYAQTGREPLLLLDDVLLELDPDRRKRFFSTLPPSSQAIFTFLPGEDWEGYRLDGSLVYRVVDGRFTHQDGP
ncbi:MAG TPA: DNA replication and repair protein RecF [Rectinemataceae bacterium]|nr:DNA replication and repair protein RecF [Rectinemataceae bacterium]